MLTTEEILHAQRFNEQMGFSNRGACFGVTDSSRLRASSAPFSLLRAMVSKSGKYLLEFRGFRNRIVGPYSFDASNNGLAIIKAMRELKIKGKLTRGKFNYAGGKAIFCGRRQIFPKPKKQGK